MHGQFGDVFASGARNSPITDAVVLPRLSVSIYGCSTRRPLGWKLRSLMGEGMRRRDPKIYATLRRRYVIDALKRMGFQYTSHEQIYAG